MARFGAGLAVDRKAKQPPVVDACHATGYGALRSNAHLMAAGIVSVDRAQERGDTIPHIG